MRRAIACTLVFILIFIPVYPLSVTPDEVERNPVEKTLPHINFHALTEIFGREIPVVVSFSERLDESTLQYLDSLDIQFD